MSELVWSVLNQISVLSLISVMAGSNNYSTVVHACECVENEPTVQSDIRCNNCNKRISQGDDIFFMLDLIEQICIVVPRNAIAFWRGVFKNLFQSDSRLIPILTWRIFRRQICGWQWRAC